MLFTARNAGGESDSSDIVVVNLREHRRKTLVRGGTFGRYLPSGHFTYVNRGTLFAAPFDLDKLELRGRPVPVLFEVAYSPQFGSVQLDFSRNGTLVYRTGEISGLSTVQWLSGMSKVQALLAKPGLYFHPTLSPDGQRLAIVSQVGSDEDIWTYDIQRDTTTRLTFTPGGSEHPVWTPNSKGIFYRSTDGNGHTAVLGSVRRLCTGCADYGVGQ